MSPISQYADDMSLILTSDDSILAIFETYTLFEKASGVKLNQSTSKGLWLGSWCGRSDPPVALDWSSTKVKILGVFLGLGNRQEDHWHPRIDAVDRVLKSWRSRVLSFRGKSLVINALALSRVWYVASLIHMPAWVLKELTSLAFSFFWSGKHELDSCSTVVQCSLFGGFSVVDIKLKVVSLLGQWVKRLAKSPSGWVVFMSYWFKCKFDASPLEVLSDPYSYYSGFLPQFYKSFLQAWRDLDGSFSVFRICLYMVPHCVMSVPRSLLCPPNCVINICCLRTWVHRIVL